MSTLSTVRQKKALFIAKFAATLGNISEACREAGISRATYYNWTGQGGRPDLLDPEFLQALRDTEEARTDFVLGQQLKCIQGYHLPETKVYFVEEKATTTVKGKPVVTRRKVPVEVPGLKHIGPSETLIKHYLDSKARERGYGKEVTVKHSGTVGVRAIVFKEANGPAAPPAAGQQ